MPTEEDDDDLLSQIGQLGAAINASRDPDPDLSAMAQHAAEQAAAALTDQHRQEE